MAFGPITSWQIDGETVETVTDFLFYYFVFTLYYEKQQLELDMEQQTGSK